MDAIEPHPTLKWKWVDDICETCAAKALPAFNSIVSLQILGGDAERSEAPEQTSIFDLPGVKEGK